MYMTMRARMFMYVHVCRILKQRKLRGPRLPKHNGIIYRETYDIDVILCLGILTTMKYITQMGNKMQHGTVLYQPLAAV